MSKSNYTVLDHMAGPRTDGARYEDCGHEWFAMVKSVHADWRLGVWFEHEKLGGMAVHYGYQAESWALLFGIGHRTYGIGIARGRKEWRLYAQT